jgi:hypothetical protein
LPGAARENVRRDEFAQPDDRDQAALVTIEAKLAMHIVAYRGGNIAPTDRRPAFCQLRVPANLSKATLEVLQTAETEHHVLLVAYSRRARSGLRECPR